MDLFVFLTFSVSTNSRKTINLLRSFTCLFHNSIVARLRGAQSVAFAFVQPLSVAVPAELVGGVREPGRKQVQLLVQVLHAPLVLVVQ